MPSIWNQVRRVINNYGVRKETLISLIDRDGNLYSMNAEMRKMLDIPSSGKLKTNIFDLVHNGGAREFKQSVILSEQKKIPADSKLLFKNGEDHLVALKIHALPPTKTDKQLFLCMGEEISEMPARILAPVTVTPNSSPLVHLEKKIKSSVYSSQQTSYESAMMNSPVITWMVNEDEELIFANKAFRKYFSLPDEAINQDIRKFIHPNVIQSLYEKHLDAFLTEKPIISVEKAFFANGETLHFQVFLFIATTEAGKKVVTGQAYRIDEQIETGSNIRSNENAIINNLSNDAIWEWDMQSGKIFRNTALLQMIGFPEDDLVGLVWWLKRIHPADRKRISDTIKKATDKSLPSWEEQLPV